LHQSRKEKKKMQDCVYVKTFADYVARNHNMRGAEGQAIGDILGAIGSASKIIANQVAMSSIHGTYGLKGNGAGGQNATGDDQKELDVMANEVMLAALRGCGRVCICVSEEDEEPVVMRAVSDQSRYAVVFDPVDGSSNIECSVSVGTIFGVYRIDETFGPLDEPDAFSAVLRAGHEMVAAGYVLYSTSTMYNFSVGGQEVRSFVLDPRFGEYVEDPHRSPLRIPEKPKKIISVNSGNSPLWNLPTSEFVSWAGRQEKPYSHRYIGSMVADVHRTLLYGGIFLYPADHKSRNGKLRMLYECFPMAYLVEAAGGQATNGTTRILDLIPQKIHERSPIFIGCSRDVAVVENIFSRVPMHFACEVLCKSVPVLALEDSAEKKKDATGKGGPHSVFRLSKDFEGDKDKFELSGVKDALFTDVVKIDDAKWALATCVKTGARGSVPSELILPR
jgi:fructose-1,6-bisphosphatase I